MNYYRNSILLDILTSISASALALAALRILLVWLASLVTTLQIIRPEYILLKASFNRRIASDKRCLASLVAKELAPCKSDKACNADILNQKISGVLSWLKAPLSICE